MKNVNIIESKKLFFRFLKENNAYVNYITLTFYKINFVITKLYLHEYINCISKYKGWYWSDSPQGNAYWSVIHAKWLCHLYEIYRLSSKDMTDKIVRNMKNDLDYNHGYLDEKLKNEIITIINNY